MFLPLHDQNKLENIGFQYVTIGLVLVNVLIFLITGIPEITSTTEANAIYYSYGFVPAVVNDVAELPVELAVFPEEVSYISYAFLHAGFMHLIGNILFLWVFGDNVEDAMGHFRFFLFYIACAAAGAYVHALSFPTSQAPLIGASGAAAGVIGAYLVLHPKVKIWVLAFGRIPLRLTATWVLGGWIAFQIFNYLMPGENEVSFAAHIGGFFLGAFLILFMRKRGVPLWDQNLQTNPKTSVPAEELSPRTWGRPKE